MADSFEEDIKKFLGLPPYDGQSEKYGPSSDFAKYLEKKYGRPIAGSIQKFFKTYQNGRYLDDPFYDDEEDVSNG